jgi:hypothetical protein
MNISTSTLPRWLLALVCVLVLAGIACWYWPQPRGAMYSIYRESGKSKTLSALANYETKSSQHFVVYFTSSDENVAAMILETAESVYQPVVKQMGHEPGGKVPLVVYASRDDLRHAFGWGNSESAVGVYWAGTIRLLSPNVWIHDKRPPQQQQAYAKVNPIAHEFTHYLLDYMTNGNYPRWFTEGLAQWVEHRVTGYLWIEDSSKLDQKLYTMDDLNSRFDSLPNQALAYRESYLIVDYIAQTQGDQGIADLVQKLQAGHSFTSSLQQVTGHSESALYDQWFQWVQQHLSALNRAE